jgi:anionic cell wall polymer biosynthesis LytR-Cps2A-Psr (LCP) family protein
MMRSMFWLNSRKKIIILWACVTSLFALAVGVTVWQLSERQQVGQGAGVGAAEHELTEGELVIPTALPDDATSLTVLLLGYGGDGHQGGYLTDVLQVVRVDFEKKEVALISLPRDLYVTLPNGIQAKINAAFTLGKDPTQRVASGAEVAKRMAEQVLGIPVDNVIAVDFVNFQRTVGGWLGGIEVVASETLDDPWYPVRGLELETCGKTPEEVAQLSAQLSGFELEKQFPCRYEHVYFARGTHKMQGGEALKFVRSRHGSSAGDFSRSRRQHEVLAAIAQKIISLKALSSAPEYFAKAEQLVFTDITLADVEKLAPALQTGIAFPQKNIVLSTENVFVAGKSKTGQSILQPRMGGQNWTQVHEYLSTQLAE